MTIEENVSLIGYARYYGLARHFRPDYAANLLAEVASTAPVFPAEIHEPSHHCDDLVNRMEQEYELLIRQSDEPIKVSGHAFEILASCQAPKKPDVEAIYRGCASKKKSTSRLKLEEPLLIIGGGEPKRDARQIRDGVDLQLLLQVRMARIATKHTEAKDLLPEGFAADVDNASGLIYSEINTGPALLTAASLEMLRSATTTWVDDTARAIAIESTLPKRHLTPVKDTEVPLDMADLGEESEDGNELDASTTQVHFDAIDTTIPTWSDVIDDDERDTDVWFSADPDTKFLDKDDSLLQRAISSGSAAQQLIPADNSKTLAQVENGPLKLQLNSAAAVSKLAVPKLEPYQLRSEGCDLAAMLRPIAENTATNELDIHQKLQLSDLIAIDTAAKEPVEEDIVGDQSALRRFLGKPKSPIRSEQLLWKEPGLRLVDSDHESDDKVLTLSPSDVDMSVESDAEQNGRRTVATASQEGSGDGQMSTTTDSVNGCTLPGEALQQFDAQLKPFMKHRVAKAGPWKLRLSRSSKAT